MSSPSTSLATLRPDLGGSFEEFDVLADQQGFIGLQIMPVVNSELPGGTFGKIPLEELLQNPEVDRDNKSGYNRIDWNFTDEPFATHERGLEIPVDRRAAAMYKNYFSAEMISAKLVRAMVLLAAEKRYAAKLFSTDTFSGDMTNAVTNEWDDFENATPIDDIAAACLAVWLRTGVWPNALVTNRLVFRNLRRCDQVKESIQSAGAGSATKATDITAAMLASVFDMEKVIVAGGAKNAADKGQNRSISQVWSNEYALVTRVGSGDEDIVEPCIGNTIHWAGDGSQVGGTMETYYDERVRGDVVRCRHDVDEKVKYPEMGQLLSNITT
jgi:hypothetical protein